MRQGRFQKMKSHIKSMFCLMAAAFLLTAIVPLAPAQSIDDEDHERGGCSGTLDLKRLRCEREIEAREARATMFDALEQTREFDEPRLPLALIRQDLRFLQSVTGYLSHAASQSGALDFKAITKSASEIKKRAARLEASLALPRSEKMANHSEGQVSGDAEQLRIALFLLSSLISDAVRNPVLKGYSLDGTSSAKARGELDGIIELSARISRDSKRLGKTGQ
jgi:hypothetical protein